MLWLALVLGATDAFWGNQIRLVKPKELSFQATLSFWPEIVNNQNDEIDKSKNLFILSSFL